MTVRINKAVLQVERLESRDLASATATLANGVLSIISDNQPDIVRVSTPRTGVTEVFSASDSRTNDFTGVTSISFQGGRNGGQFYNNTALPSTQRANNNPASTQVLVGGSSNDVLDGSAAKGTVYETLTASGTESGGSGTSNLFALGGTHTITTGSGLNQVYSIVGADTFNAQQGSGYLLVSAKAALVNANKSYQIVTFFQPAQQGPQKVAAVEQKDVNGNTILYLTPLNPTANVNYQVSLVSGGKVIAVEYSDSQGAIQTVYLPAAGVSWVVFFSISGVSNVTVNANLNTVLYGKSGSTLVGGEGQFNVLKVHSGSGVAIGRASVLDDLFAGPAGATAGATLQNSGGPAVFRNATDRITTRDLGVDEGDTVIGVPAQLNGQFSADAGQPAQNADYGWLALLLSDKRRGN
jgi:hypothetical protein